MDGHGADRTERSTASENAGGHPPSGRFSSPPPAKVPLARPRDHHPPTYGEAPVRDEAPFEVQRYDPGRFLQGLVASAWRQAEDRGKAVHIQGTWPTIAVYPNSFAAVVERGEDGLRTHAGREDLPLQANLVFAPAPFYEVNHPDMVPLDILLWKLALGASRGRLPLGTSLDTPVALREWPNFTRLVVTPGAMSVAALWARQTCTLGQTIHLLGLPPADVFAFYSAAAAIDLVRPELPSQPAPATRPAISPAAPTHPSPPPSPPPPAITPAPRRNLLRKVFDKLRTT